MFWKRIVTTDTLFTLPKPRVHLFYHLIDIVLERGIRRGGESLQRFNVGTQEFPVLTYPLSKQHPRNDNSY